ncbi:hypothetical protein Barb4_03884 [Bacteroidales bacterium Barb4]|nr:hypothetical protein Barb4_03884 [Bacteroidales bacterium Barb4]
MMIYHHPPPFGGKHGGSHLAYTLRFVEVKAENNLRFGNQPVGKLRLFLIYNHLSASRQPLIEGRERIRHDNRHLLFPATAQKMGEPQRRPQRITVRRHVRYNHKPTALLYVLARLVYLFLSNNLCYHAFVY